MNNELFTSVSSETPDLSQASLAKLKTLFPHFVTESEKGLAIDWDLMRQEFSNSLVEGEKERYRLDWPGKREALFTANRPTTSTLRPDRESSKDFDTTQNLYIDGDNLEALKLLRQSYLGKVKMIYIDPPYNTGNDFIYNDDFARTREAELKAAGRLDAEGRRTIDNGAFRQNTEANGRYHSDWLSMMYPRLKLARDLLADDGVIFISIDDNEQANLKKLCDEIFGEANFVATFVWEKTQHFGHQKVNSYSNADYLLCYASVLIGEKINEVLVERIVTQLEDAPLYNASNNVKTLTFPKGVVRFNIPDGVYEKTDSDDYILTAPVTVKEGKNLTPLSLSFRSRWSNNTCMEEVRKGSTFLIRSRNFSIRVIYGGARFSTVAPKQIIFTNTQNPHYTKCRFNNVRIDTSENATNALKKLIGEDLFAYPKPISLIVYLCSLVYDKCLKTHPKSFIVLDFFSGSATTAHAVMQLNAEDGGRRKYIMVQLPEACDEKKEAYKAGYKNICEIGKERIRRAGEQIKAKCLADGKAVPDIGFRVLKVDSSNLVETKKRPEVTTVDDLFEGTIKADRTEEDLLFQAIRETGALPLTCKIEKQAIHGVTIWVVDDGSLVACLAEEGITAEVAAAIAEMMPAVAVFRENGFANDTVKANVAQQFVQRQCATTLKVL